MRFNSALACTRVCAFALNQATRELGFGNMSEWFDGEDISQWAVVNYSEVRCIKHDRLTAIFLLEDDITIHIPDVHYLIRGRHLSEFDHRQYGIQDKPIPNPVTEIAEPQLIIECSYPETNEIPRGPRNPLPIRQIRGRVTLERQYQPIQ